MRACARLCLQNYCFADVAVVWRKLCIHSTARCVCVCVGIYTPPSSQHTSHFSLFLPLAPLTLTPVPPPPLFPELANQIQYSIIQDIQQGESWENGKPPRMQTAAQLEPHAGLLVLVEMHP